MTSALTIISAVLQLLPALISAIRAIEEAIPGSGQGSAKLAAIRQIIETISDQAANLWPALEKVITVLVATFNTVGVFKKGASA